MNNYSEFDERWLQRSDSSLLRVSEIMLLPDPRWRIEGFLPEQGTAVLYGPSGHGKSIIAMQWAAHVALGRPWCGKHVIQAPVLYIAAEGGLGIKKRIRGLMQSLDVRDIPGLIVKVRPLDIHEDDQVEAFISEINQLDLNLGMLVIDTLAASFGGRDENATADMTMFVRRITEIANDETLTALVVHHTGISTTERGRGSSALVAGVDAQFKVLAEMEPETDTTPERILRATLTCDKQKDSEKSRKKTFLPVYVGDKDRGTLLLREATPDQVAADEAAQEEQENNAILDLLRDRGGLSKNAIAKFIHKRREDVWRRVEALRVAGRVHRYRDGETFKFSLS